MKRLLALALAMALSQSLFSQDAPAPRSAAEIQKRWDELRPRFTDWQVMEIRADYNQPFTLGKVAEGYARDALGMLNFIRFLAGLPDDLQIDPDLSHRAQALTAANAMNRVNSHAPKRPAGMPEELYALGYAAGPKSNLHMSLSEGGDPERIRADLAKAWGPYPGLGLARRHFLALSMLLYVADADYRNVRKAEHRRNLFRPQALKAGFGYVDFYTERTETEKELAERRADPSRFQEAGPWYRYTLEQYTSAFVVDSGRAKPIDFEQLTWPSRGYFPLELWSRAGACQPWSITLNPALYKVDDPAALSVSISGPGGYLVSIGAKDRPANWDAIGDDDLEEGDYMRKFLRYQPATASWLPAVLFFPGEKNWPKPEAGARYRVSLSGVRNAAGKPVTISYWVEFFRLEGAAWLENIFASE